MATCLPINCIVPAGGKGWDEGELCLSAANHILSAFGFIRPKPRFQPQNGKSDSAVPLIKFGSKRRLKPFFGHETWL
jgi:hypothetical protein